MVSVFTFFFDDPNSDPFKVYRFNLKSVWKQRKLPKKRPGMTHLKRFTNIITVSTEVDANACGPLSLTTKLVVNSQTLLRNWIHLHEHNSKFTFCHKTLLKFLLLELTQFKSAYTTRLLLLLLNVTLELFKKFPSFTKLSLKCHFFWKSCQLFVKLGSLFNVWTRTPPKNWKSAAVDFEQWLRLSW